MTDLSSMYKINSIFLVEVSLSITDQKPFSIIFTGYT